MRDFHLDTDYLIIAVTGASPERERVVELSEAGVSLAMSAIAWYEFSRGPRTPEQLAVARFFLDRIVPFGDELADRAADLFRRLGAPRRRANDLAIGVTAAEAGATLLTRNEPDFGDIPGLAVEAPR